MNSFIIYSIEIAISLALFYTAYWVFLKKETFFKLNRFYIIFSVIISLLTPLINITVGADSFIARNLILPIEQYEQSISGNLDNKYFPKKTGMIMPGNNELAEGTTGTKVENVTDSKLSPAETTPLNSTAGSNSQNKTNWLTIALVIYFTGVALFFIRFLANFIWIFGYVLKHKPQQILGMKVIRFEKNISPFSFLNFVFISNKEYPEAELAKIISHEKVHIKQKHTIDLILFELLLIFQWFNPFVWFYKHAVRINHEYLADQGTLHSGIDIQGYQYSLLNQVLRENNFEVASSYNYSVKKRIAMMLQKRSPKLSALKLTIAFPILVFLFSAFAFKTNHSKKDLTNKVIVNGDTTIKRVNVPLEYLKSLEGEYISTNEPRRVRRIIFTELLGTLHGWDNMIEFDHGYSYKIIPVGDGKFINPDDHESLVFNTKDPNAINLLLFGKINLKKVKLEQGKFANGSKAVRLSVAYPLASMMLKDGIQAALSYYTERKDSIYLAEHDMNFAGYDLLQGGKTKEATAIFKLNSELFPNSFNAYDSYAEALLALGDKNLAIENFIESVKLNPGSRNGLKRLKELGVNTDGLVKKYTVTTEELKLLEGDYLSTNQPTWMRWIKFEVEDGVLIGNDNGYRYKLLPMGNGKFINPDDGVSLVFDTKDKNAISLFIFGKTIMKKVKRSERSEAINLKKYAGVYLPAKKDTMLAPMEIINNENKLLRFIKEAQGANRTVELADASDNIFFFTDGSYRSIEFVLDDKKEVTTCLLRRSDGVYTLSKKK